jgi:L-malate glycosyltransferase
MAWEMIPKQQPRILFAGPMLGRHPGWVPSPAEELAPRLRERGFVCSLTSSLLNRYLRTADIIFTIVRYHKQVDILCLQVYSGPSFLVEDLASLLARFLGMRIVMVLHGGGMPDFIQRFPNWSRRMLARAQLILTPSSFLAKTILPFGFHSTIIPNAIQLDNYPCRFRKNVRPHLLWMRTFHEIYNPEMAVDTLEQLAPDYPDATLTMAGQEKGLLNTVRTRVKEKHLESRVHFAGFLGVRAKQDEFESHDVFINTNRVDNMPVSVIEACAFGMPIIATSVGGVPFLIQDGENGLLVPNDDSIAMALAVRRLIDEPGLVERLSRNARGFGESHDWSIVLPQWENAFYEVMGGKAQ